MTDGPAATRSFVTVAQFNSFTRAAQQLHTAQSAVSATIAALEKDVGTRLFDRSTRTVELTAAGSALLPKAQASIWSFREARDAVEAVVGGITGSINLGFLTSVRLVDIPKLLGAFSRSYPAITLTLTSDPAGTSGLAERLHQRDLDLAVLGAHPQEYPHLDLRVLASSKLRLTVPLGHRLADRDQVSLLELENQRFVDSPTGYGNRTAVDGVFSRAGATREVRVETADIKDSASLVQHGLGIAFLPEFLVQDLEGVRLINVQEEEPVLVISLARSSTQPLTIAASRLWDIIINDGAA